MIVRMRIQEWTMKEIRLIKKEGIRKEMGRNDEECVSYGGRNSWMGRILQGKGKWKRES
jgi:hypothetical protein